MRSRFIEKTSGTRNGLVDRILKFIYERTSTNFEMIVTFDGKNKFMSIIEIFKSMFV